MHIVHVMASSQMGEVPSILALLPELRKRSFERHGDYLAWRRASERLRALGVEVRTPVDMDGLSVQSTRFVEVISAFG